MDKEKGEREEKVKESKAPSTQITTVPISQGPGLKNPLGEAGKQEEEKEEGPVSEHLYKERKPSGTQSAPSPEGVGQEIQRKAEAKK